MLQGLKRQWQARGSRGVVAALQHKLRPKSLRLALCRAKVAGKNGLEIGGPSPIFSDKGQLPLYQCVGTLDCLNFASQTLWEGQLVHGAPFISPEGRPLGRQLVGDMTRIASVADHAYDFVLSSHVIEHTANPLAALDELRRILMPGGPVIMITPHYRDTFDRRRPVSTLEHLMRDYEGHTTEADLSHREESLALHDFSWDLDSLSRERMAELSADNEKHRVLHHHVFDEDLVHRMLHAAGFTTLVVERAHPCHIIAIAQAP